MDTVLILDTDIMWYIILAIWIIGSNLAYTFIKKWDNNMLEKIGYSVMWPIMLPLYIIHYIHDKV